MIDRFYCSFEERYYAPREVIKALRSQYLPFVRPLAGLYPGASIFDAGCGRGEWLELMAQLELSPFGVDLDEGMLSACVEQGLSTRKGDAVEYLTTLPSDSQAVVSAFHVVEHITFEQLRTLVAEALRVLKPGGLLIMETPNPENIVVATQNFYLDPTHQRPIPAQLLSFLPEYYGFARIKVLRLQESKELVENASPTLNDVLGGVSPDYAVIAQKAAPAEILELFKQVFDQEYGLSLNTLAGRYDAAIAKKVEKAETLVQQAEAKAQQAEAAVRAIYNSRSWLITRPLRWFVFQVRLFRAHGAKARVTAAARKVTMPLACKIVTFVGARPRLRHKLIVLAKKTGIYEGMKGLVYRLQRVDSRPAGGVEVPLLTPRARQIYNDLKTTIDEKKRGA